MIDKNQIIMLPNDTLSVSFEDFPKLNTEVDNLFVPNGCYWIKEYAFRNLPNLKAIWLPETLTVLNKTALSGLDNLEYLIVHNMETDYGGSQGYEYPDNFNGLFATHEVSNFLNKFFRNYHRKLNIISVNKS